MHVIPIIVSKLRLLSLSEVERKIVEKKFTTD